MIAWWWILVAASVGGVFGFITAVLCFAAAAATEAEERSLAERIAREYGNQS